MKQTNKGSMNIQNQIEKQVHEQIQYYLDEYDFDAEIKRLTNNKTIDAEIKRLIKEKVAQAISDRFMKAFIKQNKIIDAWADNKLRTLLKELGLEL